MTNEIKHEGFTSYNNNVEARKYWWECLCLSGDPLRIPNLPLAAFDAGFVMARQGYNAPRLAQREVELMAEIARLETITIRLLNGSRIAEVEATNKDLLAALEKFAEWNVKYPSTTIYSHAQINRIAAELDLNYDEAKAARARAREVQS